MKRTRSPLLLMPLFWLVSILPASAWYPRLPGENSVDRQARAPIIGVTQRYHIGSDDTVIQLARAFGLGYQAVARANPLIDPWLPRPGQTLVLPYATVLPRELAPGITINLAEYRLYLVEERDGKREVRIYPVGVGTEGWETPEGDFRILRKVAQPTWNVPASIRAEDPTLPAAVPPGPENPLGEFWIEFSDRQHGIHGTNRPYGVGRRVSHGCIRLYPEDIRDLYARVSIGTPVRIVYAPLKVGFRDGQLHLEAHEDYLGRIEQNREAVLHLAAEIGWQGMLDQVTVDRILAERRGLPLPVPSYNLKAQSNLRSDPATN